MQKQSNASGMSQQVTFAPAVAPSKTLVSKLRNMSVLSLSSAQLGYANRFTPFQQKAKKALKHEAKNCGFNMCATQPLLNLAQPTPKNQFDDFDFEFETTSMRPTLERRNAEGIPPRVGDIIDFHIEQSSEQCGCRRSNATAGNRRRQQRSDKLALADTLITRYYAPTSREW
jgi:hypothetical protein